MSEATLPLSRRERERLRRREAILQAARAVFAERGYENATLDEVAERAEFGKGTLYNYFDGGKQGILFAIFDDVFDDLRGLMADSFSPEVWDDRPFRQVFQDFAAKTFAFFSEHQDLFMILVKESQRMLFSANEERASYFMRQEEQTMEVLSHAIERAIDAGEVRNLPPHAAAHVVMGNIKGIHMHHCMFDRPCHQFNGTINGKLLDSPEESARFLTNLIFDGLQGGKSNIPSEARS